MKIGILYQTHTLKRAPYSREKQTLTKAPMLQLSYVSVTLEGYE